MSHTNSTANLSLPQFIGTDKPTWLGDINGAFSAIDAYAGTNDAAVSAAASDASSAISQAAAAVNTANTANTTAGNASTAANNAVGVANTANAIAGAVDAKVGLLADLTTTDRTSIVNAINEVNAAVGTVPTAAQVTYDNTGSGLTATNVQDAIDEVAQGGGGASGSVLIWSNPDNTQSFAGQAVNVTDNNAYSYFLIFVKQRNNIATFTSSIVRLNDTAALMGVMPSALEYRTVATSKVGSTITFTFDDGKSHPYGTGSDTTTNTSIIPDAIYGVY